MKSEGDCNNELEMIEQYPPSGHFRSAYSARVILITPSTCQPEVWASIASGQASIESKTHNHTVQSVKKYALTALVVGKQFQVTGCGCIHDTGSISFVGPDPRLCNNVENIATDHGPSSFRS